MTASPKKVTISLKASNRWHFCLDKKRNKQHSSECFFLPPFGAMLKQIEVTITKTTLNLPYPWKQQQI